MKNSHHSQKYFYTKDEIDYLKKIIIGRTSNEIIGLYNTKFNKNMTYNQLLSFQKKYKIRSGLDTTFKKNKIKNPNPPQQIGYECIYYEKGKKHTKVKISNKKWVEKSRYVYEQHYGKIPDNCVIIFLDGNRDNYDIKNLKCITHKEHEIMAGNNLYFKNKELNETSIAIAKLMKKAKEVKKNNEK